MNLEIFKNNGYEIRGGLIDGEPYFVAMDIAEMLGYEEPHKAVQQHCRNVTNLKEVLTRGKIPDKELVEKYRKEYGNNWASILLIKESDTYRLIMRSNMPDAVKIQDWVVEEVLPSIRKHGAYMTEQKIEEVLQDPDTIIKLAQNLKEEMQKRKELENKIDTEYKPKALFADSVAQSKTSILIGQFAKAISTDNFKIGQNRLFKWLRENGYLINGGQRHNQPMQKYIDNGYFEVIERTVNNPDGSTRITITTKITGKGQVALTKKIKEEFLSFDEAA